MDDMKIYQKIFYSLSTLAMMGACQNASTPDARPSLSGLTNNVILATYDDLADESQTLADTLTALCSAPSQETLDAAQEKWSDVRSLLKKVEVVSFGPYKDSDYDAKLDFWPVRTNNIEEAILQYDSFSSSTLVLLGVSVRGLPTLEYLIFGETGDADVLASLTSQDRAAARCALIVAVGSDVAENTEALYQEWAATGDNFAGVFSGAGTNDLYPTQQSAMTEAVNQMAFLVELVKDTKLGKPLGYRSGGTPQPSQAESLFSSNSVQDMVDNLEGLKSFYTGSYGEISGSSIYHVVAQKDAYIAGVAVDYIDDAIAAVKDIPEPYTDTVVNQPATAELAYEKLSLLKALVSGPISGLLGVTPYFNDNDGD